MEITMIIACGVLICASTIPFIEATRRVKKSSTILSWTFFFLSLLFVITIVLGSLRGLGILSQIDDELTIREITNLLGGNIISLAIIVLFIGLLIIDCFLWLLIHYINNQNKVWWICGSLFAFLAGIFIVALITKISLGVPLSLSDLFFSSCCATMALPGWALGLTYKQICVIVNIYLEASICLLSALWLAKILFKRAREKKSFSNYFQRAIVIIYALAYIVAFIGVVAYYPPPLEAAFDKCFSDLNRWADDYNTTYNMVNYVIFIIGVLVIVVFNCLLAHILKPKSKVVNIVDNKG